VCSTVFLDAGFAFKENIILPRSRQDAKEKSAAFRIPYFAFHIRGETVQTNVTKT